MPIMRWAWSSSYSFNSIKVDKTQLYNRDKVKKWEMIAFKAHNYSTYSELASQSPVSWPAKAKLAETMVRKRQHINMIWWQTGAFSVSYSDGSHTVSHGGHHEVVRGGRLLLPEILWQSDRVGAKSPIFDLFSRLAPQPYHLAKKFNQHMKSTRFPMSPIWTSYFVPKPH